jgi:peroxiredoxin
MKFALVLAAAFVAGLGAAQFGAALAGDMAELGPPVGAAIPHDLSATAQDGSAQTFDSLAGERGVALFFVRSVDWCPFCKAQVIDVSERAGDFAERGLNVVFVSYDPPEAQAAFKSQQNIGPTFLSDSAIEIINAFGLRNENYEEGSRAYGVPHPAVFIVGNDRVIAAKLYEEDYATNSRSYSKRPAVDAILSAVDEAIAAGSLAAAGGS